MKNVNLGQKIKELRNRLGLSQDQLADQTQLSLRTIQRIENGETNARGESLVRLSKALSIPTNELFDWTEQEDSSYLILINLSALSFILFPLLGIIIPLAVWVFKRDKIKYMDETGRKLLNFQITWCLVLCMIYLWLLGIFDLQIDPPMNLGRSELGVLIIYLLYAVNLILILVNTVKSARSKNVFYQPAIPFLR